MENCCCCQEKQVEICRDYIQPVMESNLEYLNTIERHIFIEAFIRGWNSHKVSLISAGMVGMPLIVDITIADNGVPEIEFKS